MLLPEARVLVVSHYALPHVGGIENAVDLEIGGLAAAVQSVTRLTSDLKGAGHEPKYPANVTTVQVLTFTERSPDAIRAAIRAALATALDDVFPELSVWTRRLLKAPPQERSRASEELRA